LLLSKASFAGNGDTGVQFLRIGVGARAVGMGEAQVGLADDINSIYWNPAGLNILKTAECSFMQCNWFEDISYQYFGYAQPTGFGIIGGAVNYLTMNPIMEYDKAGYALNQSYKPTDTAYSLVYANRIWNIPVGASLKYITSSIQDEKTSAVAVDIGGLYTIIKDKLDSGIMIQNMGNSMKYISKPVPLPFNIKLGVSYKTKIGTRDVIYVGDINLPRSSNPELNFGAELKYNFTKYVLRPRVGYKTDNRGLDGISGVRLGIGVFTDDYTIDYAWAPYGSLGYAHIFSFNFKFTALRQEIVVNPPIFEEISQPVQTNVLLKWFPNGNPDKTKYELTLSKDGFVTDFSTPVKLSDNYTMLEKNVAVLTRDTTYYVRIRAMLKSVISDYSDTITFYVMPDKPVMISSFSGTMTSANSIDWKWVAALNATKYKIFDSQSRQLLKEIDGNEANIWDEQGLTPKTSYTRYIVACNISGESGPSQDASAITADVPPAKLLIFAGVAQSTCAIEWQWNVTENATGYRIYDSQTKILIADIQKGSANTWLEERLQVKTEYTRYIRPYNLVGEGPETSPAIASTLALPSKINGFKGMTQSTHSIEWVWNEVTDVTGYRIYSHDNRLIKEIPVGINKWLETELFANTMYTRYITAYFETESGVSESEVTEQASATTFELQSVIFIEQINKVAKDIQFDTGKDVIREESYLTLDQIAELVIKFKPKNIQVEGHTDNKGNPDRNLDLSQKRANSVKKYLVNKGVPAEILNAIGFGMTKPVDDNNTEEGRYKNRRVEFIIVTDDGTEIRSKR
jgi:outer membrane protein OmpA-like peptidoglycan-associated protein